MRITIILLTTLVCSNLFSQKQSQIDSLELLLKSNLGAQQSLTTKIHLSHLLENSDRSRSKRLAEEVLGENRSFLVSDSLKSAAYLRLAVAAYKEKKDSLALTFLNNIDSLYTQSKSIIAPLVLSKIYRSQISKFTFSIDGALQAKKYILEGQSLAEDIQDESLQNIMLYNLGEWHGFFSQAEFPEKHLDTAKMYFEKVLPYFKNSGNLEYVSRVYFSLASVAVYNKNFDQAEKFYLQRLNTLIKTKDSIQISNALAALGGYYRRTKQPKKALQKLDEAFAIANIKGYSDFEKKGELMHSYALVYEQSGDYKAATNVLFEELKLRDSLYEDINAKTSIEMTNKYESEKQQQEIILLKSQNALAEQQKKNERNLMLGGLGLTTAAGIFLFLGYRNRKKTNDKLRELDATKSNFFANISHEFRTPLSLISGPIEEQLQKATLSTQETQNLQAARRNSNRLLTLVDQLLDLSKLESGQLNLKVQQGNLSNFIKSLASVFKFQASEKEQEYNITVNIAETTYWFDADALEKITTNLLANAIKYSPNKAKVWFEASIVQGALHLIISNSGVVLKKGVLETLFNRFQRADEQTTGSGIGLALTKELVELHKGSIKVSNDDNWMVFTTIIPVTAKAFFEEEKIPGTVASPITKENDFVFAKASLGDSRPSVEHNGKIKTQEEVDIFEKDTTPIVLIVDDNEDLRVYLSSLFADHYTIKTAVNGKEGYGIAQKVVPDLIITDLMMPQEDGLIFTKNCKTNEATSHIPVLMLTAKAGDENQLLGLETGADAYITKPFSTEILKTTVLNLLDSRKKLQERYSQEVVLLPKDLATNSIEEKFLENLKTVLDDKLIESDFNTEDFAKELGMSRMQLHRKLKALTGLSATEFVRSQRLKLAAQLLKKSDINVSQIGYSVGFNNHSYFTKCFKEHYGVSPSEYVKKS